MTTKYDYSNPQAVTAQNEYDAKKKYALIAWIIWLPFGSIGGHRYYLKSYGIAIMMTLFFIACWSLWFLIVPPLLPFVWALIDALFINHQVDTANQKVYSKVFQKHGTMLYNPFIS